MDLSYQQKEKQDLFLDVAETILMQFPIKTLDDTDEMYLYDGNSGKWVGNGEVLIADEIFKSATRFSRADIQEVIAKIKHKTRFSREFFDPPHLLGLRNGCYSFTTEQVNDHYPENFLTRTIPVFFDPDAECPEFLKFLYDVVGPEQIDLLFEIIGYCLLPGYPFHKAFMFIGSGANGKSTLLQVIEQFLGRDNISHISLQDFERQFSANRLYGRMANISADLPAKPVRHTGIFKQLTGGDTIWADIKYHKSGISFMNQAKMFFSMNKPPAFLYDDSDAIWRRIMIINFPNTFEGEEADRQIIDKLTQDKELSGILNLALSGLSNLLQRGGFEDNINETRGTYIHLSNSIQAFVEDMITNDPEQELPDEEVYANYMLYCKNEKLEIKAKGTLTKHLPKYCDSFRRRSGNDFFWRGIGWK